MRPKAFLRFDTEIMVAEENVVPTIYREAIRVALDTAPPGLWPEGTDENEPRILACMAAWLLIGKLRKGEGMSIIAQMPASAVYFAHKFADTTSTSWRFWRHGTALRNTPDARVVVYGVLQSIEGVFEEIGSHDLGYATALTREWTPVAPLLDALFPPDLPDMTVVPALPFTVADSTSVVRPLMRACPPLPTVNAAVEVAPRLAALVLDPMSDTPARLAQPIPSAFLFLIQHSADDEFMDVNRANLAYISRDGPDWELLGVNKGPFVHVLQDASRCFRAFYKDPAIKALYNRF